MVTGGRVLHHLMQRLPDKKNLVLFIGFQAPGTRGFTIKNGAEAVKMFGQEVPIRAQVAALEQFSDHADTAGAAGVAAHLQAAAEGRPSWCMASRTRRRVARCDGERPALECAGGGVSWQKVQIE